MTPDPPKFTLWIYQRPKDLTCHISTSQDFFCFCVTLMVLMYSPCPSPTRLDLVFHQNQTRFLQSILIFVTRFPDYGFQLRENGKMWLFGNIYLGVITVLRVRSRGCDFFSLAWNAIALDTRYSVLMEKDINMQTLTRRPWFISILIFRAVILRSKLRSNNCLLLHQTICIWWVHLSDDCTKFQEIRAQQSHFSEPGEAISSLLHVESVFSPWKRHAMHLGASWMPAGARLTS